MKDLATFLLVGAAAFLVYKAFENKPLTVGNSNATGDDKKILPPMPKDMPRDNFMVQEEVIVEPIDIPLSSTFDINVVDPKFGFDFFNNGVQVY
jgi:hypothetical protein